MFGHFLAIQAHAGPSLTHIYPCWSSVDFALPSNICELGILGGEKAQECHRRILLGATYHCDQLSPHSVPGGNSQRVGVSGQGAAEDLAQHNGVSTDLDEHGLRRVEARRATLGCKAWDRRTPSDRNRLWGPRDGIATTYVAVTP